MTHISAADQHAMYTKEGKWRLLYNESPLAEASSRGFRYGKRFGRTRRLPERGVLSQDDIQRIVLGWQTSDESWHLGLLLAPAIAEERGSRWVELVHWPDPEITVFQDLAQTSGQELAQAIGVPFYVIPPRPAKPPPPPRPLPPLPVSFGNWRMEALPQKRQYVIKRTGAYLRESIRRMLWYSLWSVVYMVLSLATLFGDIALPVAGTLLPNPQILPYLGITISVMLVFGVFFQLAVVLLSTSRIVIDGQRHVVTGWGRSSMRWTIPQVEIQSIYISEVVKKRAKVPETEYGEINLHLGGGKFQFLVQHEDPEDNRHTPQPDVTLQRSEGVTELTRDTLHTDLQIAAMYIAEALGDFRVWYDIRVK